LHDVPENTTEDLDNFDSQRSSKREISPRSKIPIVSSPANNSQQKNHNKPRLSRLISKNPTANLHN